MLCAVCWAVPVQLGVTPCWFVMLLWGGAAVCERTPKDLVRLQAAGCRAGRVPCGTRARFLLETLLHSWCRCCPYSTAMDHGVLFKPVTCA